MMIKYIILLFIILSLLLYNCKEVSVYYPLPIRAGGPILVETSNGVFSDYIIIQTSTIYEDVLKELKKAGLHRENIDRIKLEGAAYIIKSASDSNAVVNAIINLSYDTLSGPTMVMENIRLGDIINKPQVDALTLEGVSILNQALEDLVLLEGQTADIIVNLNGSLLTNFDITFEIIIEFTITTVIKKTQDIFDPLG
jgi:hypothetical protein